MVIYVFLFPTQKGVIVQILYIDVNNFVLSSKQSRLFKRGLPDKANIALIEFVLSNIEIPEAVGGPWLTHHNKFKVMIYSDGSWLRNLFVKYWFISNTVSVSYFIDKILSVTSKLPSCSDFFIDANGRQSNKSEATITLAEFLNKFQIQRYIKIS